MRGTMQNGRVGGGRHNDRDFNLDYAMHIDKSKVKDNVQISWRGKSSHSFEQDEIYYYEMTFSEALKRTNESYIRNGHAERVKKISDWINSNRTRPEETIFQLGNKDEHANGDQLLDCYKDLLKFEIDWAKEHNNAFQILNFALHNDESTPHIHQRRVWQYKDDDGIWRIGQDKALEQAGIDLPCPEKPVGRYNNRKMSFDAMMRQKWLELAKEHGLDIETEPIPDGRHHQDKESYIRKKNEILLSENDNLENENKALAEKVDALIDMHNDIVDEIETLRAGEIDIAKEVLEKEIYLERDELIR